MFQSPVRINVQCQQVLVLRAALLKQLILVQQLLQSELVLLQNGLDGGHRSNACVAPQRSASVNVGNQGLPTDRRASKSPGLHWPREKKRTLTKQHHPMDSQHPAATPPLQHTTCLLQPATHTIPSSSATPQQSHNHSGNTCACSPPTAQLFRAGGKNTFGAQEPPNVTERD